MEAFKCKKRDVVECVKYQWLGFERKVYGSIGGKTENWKFKS